MTEADFAYPDDPEMKKLWQEWLEAELDWTRLEDEVRDVELGMVRNVTGQPPSGPTFTVDDIEKADRLQPERDAALARFRAAEAAYYPAREAYRRRGGIDRAP